MRGKKTQNKITYKSKNQRIDENLHKELFEKSNRVSIVSNDYYSDKSKAILQQFSLIKVWRIVQFDLCLQNLPTILILIKQISFPNLKELVLYENEISSIEVLPSIFLPSLQTLDLSKNKIATLKSLRKATYKSMKKLQIYQNKLYEKPPISSQMYLSLDIAIDRETIYDSIPHFPDHQWIKKLSPKKKLKLHFFTHMKIDLIKFLDHL